MYMRLKGNYVVVKKAKGWPSEPEGVHAQEIYARLKHIAAKAVSVFPLGVKFSS
jgi:hypothetical protein